MRVAPSLLEDATDANGVRSGTIPDDAGKPQRPVAMLDVLPYTDRLRLLERLALRVLSSGRVSLACHTYLCPIGVGRLA